MLLQRSDRSLGKLKSNWRSGPFLILALAAFIVLAGIGTLIYNDRLYESMRRAETTSQAEVLAASMTAALDFDDAYAANEAVSAFRVNRQVRWVGAFDESGKRVAGYARSGVELPIWRTDMPREGNGIRVTVPVMSSGQKVGEVGLEVDSEHLTRRISRYFLLGALIVLAGLVLAVLGLSQASLRRANRQLEDRAEALAAANILLAEQMEVRASAEEQLRQSQKMQALGQLTGGIAHDFNNLLTVIQGSADMLTRDNLPEQKRIRFAQAIVQASANAASLTSQLLAFARRQPLKPEKIDLNDLIGSMRDLLDRTLGERITVRTTLASDGCPVEVDRAQLQSAILNVASNARDAMNGEGGLSIATRNCVEDGRAMVAIDISDTGTGIPPEVLERIFEPFFTTKGTGKGTGLGLSQVYGFATQSGGTVHIESELGDGATISIILPCADPQLAGRTEPTVADEPTKLVGRILIVEDNVEVGTFAETLLSEQGHEVALATSAEQALDLIRQGQFDLVFSDVVMPGMGGLRLAEILEKERPELPVVLATGYSQEIAESGARGRPVILKPYRLATLQSAIEVALKELRVNEPI
jgi:signal transduction histidine kinase